jgi:hypothetical protein
MPDSYSIGFYGMRTGKPLVNRRVKRNGSRVDGVAKTVDGMPPSWGFVPNRGADNGAGTIEEYPNQPLDPDVLAVKFDEFIRWSRSRPPLYRVEEVANGVHVHSPYDADFVESLKALIPSGDRGWIPGDKVWWVSHEYAEQARILFDVFFAETEEDQ